MAKQNHKPPPEVDLLSFIQSALDKLQGQQTCLSSLGLLNSNPYLMLSLL